jgi:ubiquinol-cytochrome c reductase cytochrome b subunit
VQWFESRTGVGQILRHALYENIPSGARMRYVTGSMLVFAFVTQAITGIFLWMAYSPSSQTAYESVYYIQHEMTGGWFLRGLHHFMAQAMVVVMALHLFQVVWDAAYRPPREFNHWLGLVLMLLVLGLGLTGYLLPWDQKGYWATNVATNLMTLSPGVGKEVQQLAVGGNEYGHFTLTRFFAMHTGVLPVLLVGFLVLHIAAFRKHGIMAHITPGRPDEYFWPRQVLFDALGCLALLVIVVLCVVHWDLLGLFSGNLPEGHRGAELGAPADPSEAYSAARPEWYYLFLFQLLKYFHGTQEIIGAIIIPTIVLGILFLMPLIGRFDHGHQFNRAFICVLLIAAAGLTVAALSEDYYVYVAQAMGWDDNPQDKSTPHAHRLVASREFIAAKKDADRDAERMSELINRRTLVKLGEKDIKLSEPLMVQKQGAVYLLRNDPLTRGRRLFEQQCASCHDYIGKDGFQEVHIARQRLAPKASEGKVERDEQGNIVYDENQLPNGAPNLFGFGSRAWIRGLLNADNWAALEYGEVEPSANPEIAKQADHPDNHQKPIKAPYFGNTAHRNGRMHDWLKKHAEQLKDTEAADDDLDAVVAALSAQAELRSQAKEDAEDKQLIARGVQFIQQNCANGCHRFGDAGQLGLAPDLTGYASYEWMMGFLSDPMHQRFYRNENDRMPSFAQDLDHPETNAVSPRELSLIVDWIRRDYFRTEDMYYDDQTTGNHELKDQAYFAANPYDRFPAQSHSEEEARAAVRLSRLVGEPRGALVGGLPPAPASPADQAKMLFAQNCAGCHSHLDEAGVGIAAKNPSAPNLFGFASRKWLTGLLTPERIKSAAYFGNTSHAKGEMVGFVNDNFAEPSEEERKEIDALIAALSAEAALPGQAKEDEEAKTDGTLEKGKEAIEKSWATSSCVDCHKFHDAGALGGAPDLTGYGSKAWITEFLTNPAHERFYPSSNDRMPAFAVAGKTTKRPLLTPQQLELLASWLRGELSQP